MDSGVNQSRPSSFQLHLQTLPLRRETINPETRKGTSELRKKRRLQTERMNWKHIHLHEIIVPAHIIFGVNIDPAVQKQANAISSKIRSCTNQRFISILRM
jgi:hypothetical protein